jgi:hypothetical protein
MRADPTHEAERFISLLWNDIYSRVRSMLHPHHKEHEPGGADQLRLQLGHLFDVYVSGVEDGETIIWDEETEHWIPGVATGGGSGAGQAFFEMYGLFVGTVPGPTNLTGGALTISRVLITADGACTGTAAGQAFSFVAGGGSDDNTGLTTNWADGSGLSCIVATIGTTGTYLTVDVYFS